MSKVFRTALFILVAGTFALFVASCDDNELSSQEEQWASSAHADATAEAFNHWNDPEEDPEGIPTSCARCHSTPGFRDYIGADGTERGVVDNPAPIGTVIECEACHSNTAAGSLNLILDVTFPSGVTLPNRGNETLCMTCHQGRSSTPDVDETIADAGVGDDTVSSSLRFQNIHYYAAGATLYGGVVMGGYQYAGKTYDARLNHVEDYDSCTECHNQHSLKVRINECMECHKNVSNQHDLRDVRFAGSLIDYDGDGDITEGIYYELKGMQEHLYAAIRAYARDVTGQAIVYDSHSHPYFFYDTNGNGVADPGEDRYGSFTPSLLRAAYNYQTAEKDPGAFAHGGKYILQLLYDSIEDLGYSVAGLARGDAAHFDGSKEAFRHWDEEGVVSSSCAKCHGYDGLAHFLETGMNEDAAVSNGMTCTNCHDDLTTFTRRHVGRVTFPSGLSADLGDDSNLCINCHQGRESKFSVDNATPSSSTGKYSFRNIHYIAVGAVLLGTEVKGGYEYDGKTYVGRTPFISHAGRFDTCVECHLGTKGAESPLFHNMNKPNPVDCVDCHGQNAPQPNPGNDPNKFKFSGIRFNSIDWDGDGSVTESLGGEVSTLEDALYAQIQAYGRRLGNPVVYDDHNYPYFFSDTNGNGVRDEGEDDRYGFDDKRILRAAFNLQFSKKEPHAYIHNLKYIVQLIVDSIEDLGGDVSRYVRP